MRAIQFTIDETLLRRIDRDPEAKAVGRSAFLRRAAQVYLERRARERLAQQYRQAYVKAPFPDDFGPWPPEASTWPDE
jgi:metal-responsive CopG/Arc/MetJ family transcriptional regulator